MVLAVALTFIVSPLVTRLSMDTVEVPRLSADVQRGAKIGEANIETVKVKKDTLPGGVITDKNLIVGRYAASTLYSGDYVTKEKISIKANSSDDVIASFNGSKFAMSFTIDSFAAGLSGKLQNGDIISLVVKNEQDRHYLRLEGDDCFEDRTADESESVEDAVITEMRNEALRKAIAGLPVRASWNTDYMKKVPCRFDGNPYDGCLVIGGHDSAGQFDFVSKLDKDDLITITDMTGTVFTYTVSVVRHSDNARAETR